LKVTMRDTFPVRCVEGVKNLPRIFDSLCNRQRTFQRHAIHEFHDDVVRSHVVDLTYMWMAQRGNSVGFTLEASSKLRFRNFDCHVAAETGIVRPLDLSHTA